ncbi:hypothetical protein BX666DRAFT_1944584 [Dichotomocladium elegans]|nr:hypothetical protein BX666DRAFT_1944584 [Dichotomocladium elegans]
MKNTKTAIVDCMDENPAVVLDQVMKKLTHLNQLSVLLCMVEQSYNRSGYRFQNMSHNKNHFLLKA